MDSKGLYFFFRLQMCYIQFITAYVPLFNVQSKCPLFSVLNINMFYARVLFKVQQILLSVVDCGVPVCCSAEGFDRFKCTAPSKHRNSSLQYAIIQGSVNLLSAFCLQQLTSEASCRFFFCAVGCIVVGTTVVPFVYSSGLSVSGFGLSFGLAVFTELQLSLRFHKPTCAYVVYTVYGYCSRLDRSFCQPSLRHYVDLLYHSFISIQREIQSCIESRASYIFLFSLSQNCRLDKLCCAFCKRCWANVALWQCNSSQMNTGLLCFQINAEPGSRGGWLE